MFNSYYYDSDYSSSSSVSPAETTGILAVLLAYMGMIMMISLGVYILTSIAKMKIFEKAGLPGWKA
ncbi:MAG: hypothetical protein WAV68_02025, partial [Candidatus Nanogingivalis sp.]